ncbi:hypothetical protein PVK06_047797 [Gossypium arboreum]|uniref:Uncharacterized protein n=1 Tax=Gossypium arboreum TaxID=29729 RepID=A0ABR0ME89_GOSAR|nr:hypothetical protein PVK06_047797 [Gossypium arboreum]
MIPEKGYNLESNDKMIMSLSIRKTIDALNWNQLCAARSMPEEELVQEFYANLTMPYANEVLVRKKKVPLTSKSINDLFNLLDVEQDEYSAMVTNINWDFFQQIEPNELEFDESSTKSKPKADLVNEMKLKKLKLKSNQTTLTKG